MNDFEILANRFGVSVTNQPLRDFTVDFLNKVMGVSISCILDTFVFEEKDRETVENMMEQIAEQVKL